jgi:hypothetical protein
MQPFVQSLFPKVLHFWSDCVHPCFFLLGFMLLFILVFCATKLVFVYRTVHVHVTRRPSVGFNFFWGMEDVFLSATLRPILISKSITFLE